MKKHYLPILKKYLRYLIASPLLVLVYVYCETAQPMLMGSIVDDGILQQDMPVILKVGGKMILLSIIAIIVSLLNLVCASKTATGFAADLRKKVFHQIQSFSFSDIDKFSPPSLITRLTNDATALQQVILRSMLLLYRAPFMMIVAFFFVIHINSTIAGFIGLSIPILAISAFFIIKRGYPLFIKLQEKLDNVNQVVRENLINIKVVKSFVRENFEKKKFDKANMEYRDTAVSAINVIVTIFPIMQLVLNGLIILILWIGGVQSRAGNMEIGKLISLVNYSFQILSALMLLAMTIMMFARASASSQRIKEVLNTTPSIMEIRDNKKTPVITSGELAFHNVFFKYNDSEKYILKNLNFCIAPGEEISITGGTGSGKSTLLQLIPRLYEVNEGKITIDGIDIREYPLKELRNKIGVVLQKNELFSGSILDNLRWGKQDASEEEIIEAAKIAEAHHFVTSFPEQYHTILEQGGINISGGQKQRLCIARALLKKPKILLLDNSTSAVDTETERKIRNNLKMTLSGTTLLIVTQRLCTMEKSDRVMILENGSIEAFDHAEKLAKASTIYREIQNAQTPHLS